MKSELKIVLALVVGIMVVFTSMMYIIVQAPVIGLGITFGIAVGSIIFIYKNINKNLSGL